jgi:hypothetical protein
MLIVTRILPHSRILGDLTVPNEVTLDAETVWRVFVDAVDRLPDAELIEREDWVQLRTPSSPGPHHNKIMRARLNEAEADARIAEVLAEHARREAGLSWIVSPDSTPADLSARLVAAGVPHVSHGLGMVRAVPTSPPPPMPAGLRLEPTTVDDVDRIGRIVADASEREAFAERVSDWARRVFAGEGGDLRWWLAYLDDALVGSCTLRVLPNLGYLQGASVLPSQRGRGLYRAMTWMRLEQLRRRGISHAVIWADERTSGPIAQKMGFRVVTSLDYHELEAPGLDT